MNWNSETRFCVRAFVRACVRGGGREVNGVTSKITGLEGLKERGYLRGDKGDINLRMIALERWISRIVEWVIINMYGEGECSCF